MFAHRDRIRRIGEGVDVSLKQSSACCRIGGLIRRVHQRVFHISDITLHVVYAHRLLLRPLVRRRAFRCRQILIFRDDFRNFVAGGKYFFGVALFLRCMNHAYSRGKVGRIERERLRGKFVNFGVVFLRQIRLHVKLVRQQRHISGTKVGHEFIEQRHLIRPVRSCVNVRESFIFGRAG